MVQQQYKPIPKTALNDFRTTLKADILTEMGATRPPVLRVNVIRNNPRIDVYTGVQNAPDNGRISAPMDAIAFFTLIQLIEKVCDDEPDTHRKIANYTGRPDEMRIISHTYVGKDKKGCVYISLVAKESPRVKFKFTPTAYHVFMNKEGEILDEAEVTVLTAKAWCSIMKEMVPSVMLQHYEEPDYQNNTGGGNNYQNNTGNNNYQKPNNQPPTLEKPTGDSKEDDDELQF